MDSTKQSPRQIFTTAAGFLDPVKRIVYLDEACGGDLELRREVERLLDAGLAEDSSPLDEMVAVFGPGFSIAPTMDHENDHPLYSMIGPYKLLEQIGQGGFGTVHMAAQTTPVKRLVALKLLKPGMDSKEVLARFEAERQALAMMEHPNIARVLDGGTTEQGHPYFVMELVRGVAVTEFCDEFRATTDERLTLFIEICRAVQHAHQKGIIHRDLKPSNVLVTMHDDQPVPKVIDFGIAKALNQPLTDRTLYTGYHQMLGTPAYMSPEQTQMSGIDVDTRSDVYSLGVLLYELLTGTTPFEKSVLAKISLDDFRKLIREQDPPRPSTRLTTMDAMALSTIADRRRIDRRQVGAQLRGELDWIVMKALEKDRNRRYESASAFAADVQRYLDNEPVQACPASVWYRLRKFSQKNRVLLTTTAICLLVLLAASGVSLTYAFQTQGAKKEADQRRQEALAAKDESDRRLKQSRIDFDRALNSLDTIVQEVSSPEFAQLPNMSHVRDSILTKAMKFYQDIIVDHDNDPYARMKQAIAHYHIARIHAAKGDEIALLADIDQSIQILEAIIREYPEELQFQYSLTLSLFTRMHVTTRSPDERLADAERCLALTEHCRQAGFNDDPAALALLYYKIAEQLPADSSRAQEMVEKSVEICESRGLEPVAPAQIWLAKRASERGDLSAAVDGYQKGIELYEKIGADSSRRDRYIERWLSTVSTAQLAAVYLKIQKTMDAEAAMKRALEQARQLHREYSGDRRVRQSLVDRTIELDGFLRSQSRAAEAEDIAKFSLEALNRYGSGSVESLLDAAKLQQQIHSLPEALATFEKAVQVAPNSVEPLIELAVHLVNWMPDSPHNIKRAWETLQAAAEREPDNHRVLNLMAQLLIEKFRDDVKAEQIVNQILAANPNELSALVNRSRLHRFRGNLELAIADMSRVVERVPAVWTYTFRGTLHLQNGQYEQSIDDLNTAEQYLPGAHERTAIHYRRAQAKFQLQAYSDVLADLVAWEALVPETDALAILTVFRGPQLAACSDQDFRDSLQSIADRLVEKNQRSVLSLSRRANVLLDLEAWEPAKRDLADLMEADPVDVMSHYWNGLLSLHAGDEGKYQVICERLLRQTQQSPELPWNQLHYIQWTIALSASTLNQDPRLLRIAQQAVDHEPTNGQYRLGYGAALFRAGQLDEARQVLREILKSETRSRTLDGYLHYFLAMTESQLGAMEKAESHWQQANQIADAELSKSPAWYRRMTLELLRRETERLLEAGESNSEW